MRIKLNEAMIDAGIKPAELAKKLGVQRSQVTRWRKKAPKFETMCRISKILGKPIAQIWIGENN